MLLPVNSQNNDAAQYSDDSLQDAIWLVAVHFHREENCLGRHLYCHLEPLGGQGFLITPICSRLCLLWLILHTKLMVSSHTTALMDNAIQKMLGEQISPLPGAPMT